MLVGGTTSWLTGCFPLQLQLCCAPYMTLWPPGFTSPAVNDEAHGDSVSQPTPPGGRLGPLRPPGVPRLCPQHLGSQLAALIGITPAPPAARPFHPAASSGSEAAGAADNKGAHPSFRRGVGGIGVYLERRCRVWAKEQDTTFMLRLYFIQRSLEHLKRLFTSDNPTKLCGLTHTCTRTRASGLFHTCCEEQFLICK